MTYRSAKKNKRRLYKILLIIVVIFLLFYLSTWIFKGFSKASHSVFRPVSVVGSRISDRFKNMSYVWTSKAKLLQENEDLKSRKAEVEARIANYESVIDENIKLKEILRREDLSRDLVLAVILSKPNRSPYDTLILDVGVSHGIKVDDVVFAYGDIPIGKVVEVFNNSSKVILFSTSGELTNALISGTDTYFDLRGRGGGNFEMVLPRDFELEVDTDVLLPDINPLVVAKVQAIISDPRDPYKKALLSSPVNIQSLRLVQVSI